MSEAKHMPGPWVIDVSSWGLRVVASDERKTLIAGDLGNPENPACLADARLIAAAPELLEALKSVLADIGHHEGAAHVGRWYADALAAIAKAEQ